MLCLVSTLIGFLVGKLGALIFKVFRGISNNPLLETLTIMAFGYLSYMIAERVEFSGIFSLLSSAFTLKAYAAPILSEEGRHNTKEVLEFISMLFEAIVFSMIGLSFSSFFDLNWSI